MRSFPSARLPHLTSSAAIVVTIVYWGILSPSLATATNVGIWGTVSMHAVNSFLCLTEALGTNNPAPRWLTLLADIIILALYLGLAYLSKKTIGYYGRWYERSVDSGSLPRSVRLS